MRVPAHLGFDDVENLAQETPTPAPAPAKKPTTYEELEIRYRTTKPLDDGTPEQILKGLLNNQKEIRTSIQAYPQDARKFRTFLFTNSRIAAHLYSSLTPDSKKELRALVKEITDHTPDLRESLKKEHFRFDDKVRHFTLPKDVFNRGLHLGQQKNKLGLTPVEAARRHAIIIQLKERARMEGRILSQAEIREIVDARKPVPARHIQKLKEPPKAKRAVPTPGTPGATPAQPSPRSEQEKAAKAKAFGYLGDEASAIFGYLGQSEDTPEAIAKAAELEAAFRSGDVDTRVDVLDKMADNRAAFDAVDEGTLAAKDAGGAVAGFPVWTVVAIGGGVAAALGLWWWFSQRK